MADWWNMSQLETARAFAAAQRFAEKEAALDALLAGGGSLVHQATVTLTDAQILHLSQTPAQVVAAGGANTIVFPTRMVLYANTLAGAYAGITTDSDRLELKWIGGGNPLAAVFSSSTWGQVAGLLGNAAISFVDILPQMNYDAALGSLSSFADLASYNINKGIELVWQADDELTGGNAANTLRVSTAYMILNTITGLFE